MRSLPSFIHRIPQLKTEYWVTWILTVIAHWNNSRQTDMSPHWHIILIQNQAVSNSLMLCAYLRSSKCILINFCFDVTRAKIYNLPHSRVRTLTITSRMQFHQVFKLFTNGQIFHMTRPCFRTHDLPHPRRPSYTITPLMQFHQFFTIFYHRTYDFIGLDWGWTHDLTHSGWAC